MHIFSVSLYIHIFSLYISLHICVYIYTMISIREVVLKLLGGKLAHGTTGNIQSSVQRLQTPVVTGVHNVCFQQVQDDMSKTHSVNKEWEFASRGTEISLGKLVLEHLRHSLLISRQVWSCMKTQLRSGRL